MPMQQVQPAGLPSANLPDNSPTNLLGGKAGEGIVAELHGKYFTQAYRGRLWHASLLTAAAVPIFATNATPVWGLMNPAGNNTAIVPVRMCLGFSAGTGVAGQFGYAYVSPAGTAPAGTAAPISTYTSATITAAQVGASYGGNIIFGSSFTIGGVVSALKVYRYTGFSQGAPLTGTAAMYSLFEDFDGTTIIPPNTFFTVIASTAVAETSLISMTAYEIPWP